MFQKTDLSSFWRPHTSLDRHERLMTSLRNQTPALDQYLLTKSEKTTRFYDPKTAYGLSNLLNDVSTRHRQGLNLLGCYLSDWHIDDTLPPWSMCYVLSSDGHRLQTRYDRDTEHLTPELQPGDVISFNLHTEHGLTPALARPHHTTLTDEKQRLDYFSSLTPHDYFIAVSQDIAHEPTKKDLAAFRSRVITIREDATANHR